MQRRGPHPGAAAAAAPPLPTDPPATSCHPSADVVAPTRAAVAAIAGVGASVARMRSRARTVSPTKARPPAATKPVEAATTRSPRCKIYDKAPYSNEIINIVPMRQRILDASVRLPPSILRPSRAVHILPFGKHLPAITQPASTQLCLAAMWCLCVFS